MVPTLELRGCCFVGLRHRVAVASRKRFIGKRRCEVLAGSLPAEQPILPLEQVQGMTVGDRPGTHRFSELGCGQGLRTAKAGIPLHHQRFGWTVS